MAAFGLVSSTIGPSGRDDKGTRLREQKSTAALSKMEGKERHHPSSIIYEANPGDASLRPRGQRKRVMYLEQMRISFTPGEIGAIAAENLGLGPG
jgi:hypothetical protein